MADTVKIQVADGPTPEATKAAADAHTADMVRIAEGGDVKAPATMPEGGNDKFFDKDKGTYNWEAHAKDTDFRATQSDADKAKAAEAAKTPEAPKADAEVAKVADSLASKGLDLSTFSQEYAEKGELNAESYVKLEAAGFPRDLVDQFISGQQAVAQASRAQVFDAIGGEKNFTEMAEWAAENASPADLAAYNKAATSGDAATVKLAVEALYGRYTEATGSAPKLLDGTHSPSGGSAFGSWHEVQTAMSDPRYGPDDAYTRNLIAKLDRSKL